MLFRNAKPEPSFSAIPCPCRHGFAGIFALVTGVFLKTRNQILISSTFRMPQRIFHWKTPNRSLFSMAQKSWCTETRLCCVQKGVCSGRRSCRYRFWWGLGCWLGYRRNAYFILCYAVSLSARLRRNFYFAPFRIYSYEALNLITARSRRVAEGT